MVPQQPYFVPQYPSQFPPAFQGPRPQTTPFGVQTPGVLTPIPGAPPVPSAPTAPGAPPGGGPTPTWIPPVAPAPSQAHPPGEIPPGLLTLGAGKLFTFQPTLLVSEMWTDNFNFSSTDKQSDYRTVIGPGANLLINGPTTKGSISGTWGFTYDTAASSSDNFNLFPSLNASIVQIFTPRLSATVTDSYVQNNSPYQSNQFGLTTQRQTFTSNSFSLGLNYLIDRIATSVYYRNSYYSTGSTNGSTTSTNILGATAGTPIGVFNTVQLGYEYSWSDTSGTSSGSNSGQTTGNLLTASYTRQTGLYSSAGIQGSYQWLSGPQSSNSQSGSQSSSGDGQIWNVSLFSTYGLPSGLSVSGSLGYSQASGNGQSDQSGVTSNSNVTYGFGPAVASLGIFSDFQNTGLTGQNFGVVQTQGVTGSLSYTFTPLVTGSVFASYVSNGTTGLGNNSSSPNSNNWNAGANLSWQMLRWLVMNAQYSYSFWNNGGLSTLASSFLSCRIAFRRFFFHLVRICCIDKLCRKYLIIRRTFSHLSVSSSQPRKFLPCGRKFPLQGSKVLRHNFEVV